MIINPIYDAAASSNASFRSDFQTAINIYEAMFTADIAINIKVGFGEYNGTPISNPYESLGGPSASVVLTYSALAADLKAAVPNFFTADMLPASAPFGSIWIAQAQERAFGIINPHASPSVVDGDVRIGTAFTPGDERIAADLHEIGHALGRMDTGELDLFRFSAVGVRYHPSVSSSPAPALYFSLDGGRTKIADWGQNSDPADFLGPDLTPSSSLTPDDPFNEIIPDHGAHLTRADFLVMEALGFKGAFSSSAERFFDSSTGDHFYTLSATEADQIRATLPTYHDEGAPWGTPEKGSNTIDVFRFFDVATNAHFLTSSTAERDHVIATLPSYHYEGVAFEAYQSTGTDTLTLERFFNTQTHMHHYAASAAETAAILHGGAGPGWVDEGAGFILHA